MRIRLATAKDIKQISELIYLFENGRKGKTEKNRKIFRTIARTILAVAEVKKKIVGYCWAIFICYKHNKEGYIQELYVKKEYRRKGIGTELVKFVVDKLTKLGTRVIFVTTQRNNPAQVLYKKLGFKKDRGIWFYLAIKRR